MNVSLDHLSDHQRGIVGENVTIRNGAKVSVDVESKNYPRANDNGYVDNEFNDSWGIHAGGENNDDESTSGTLVIDDSVVDVKATAEGVVASAKIVIKDSEFIASTAWPAIDSAGTITIDNSVIDVKTGDEGIMAAIAGEGITVIEGTGDIKVEAVKNDKGEARYYQLVGEDGGISSIAIKRTGATPKHLAEDETKDSANAAAKSTVPAKHLPGTYDPASPAASVALAASAVGLIGAGIALRRRREM